MEVRTRAFNGYWISYNTYCFNINDDFNWKKYKAELIYKQLMNEPSMLSEEQDSLTKEYHSSSIDQFILSHIDKITFRGKENSFDECAWNGANEITDDPSDQIIRKWGWKRVSGFNVVTYDLTLNSLQIIVKGIVNAYTGLVGQIYNELKFNIEVLSSKSIYYDVSFSDMVESVRLGSTYYLNKYRHLTDRGSMLLPPAGVENKL